MGMDFDGTSLGGTLLVAMPSIRDETFRSAVVLVCAHSADGAMGVVVNRPAPLSTYATLNKRLAAALPILRVGALHEGGPAERQRCFVLHPPSYRDGSRTIVVDRHHALTSTRRVLRDIATGMGPDTRIAALGYAGWGAGQLERELRDNAWLTVPADPDLTYRTDDGDKWRRAIRMIGIVPETLSGVSGTA